eukprot:TRINITY_DN6831_c1_g1_i1.p1 TRINITY_DN6831_c1_g1~~TRINITY_DN6831_c1_g1_i1.p1  ORF type:complete len:226 (+),score=40.03 TRINITY_DN6831_c1_g1_i1:31-708(+)
MDDRKKRRSKRDPRSSEVGSKEKHSSSSRNSNTKNEEREKIKNPEKVERSHRRPKEDSLAPNKKTHEKKQKIKANLDNAEKSSYSSPTKSSKDNVYSSFPESQGVPGIRVRSATTDNSVNGTREKKAPATDNYGAFPAIENVAVSATETPKKNTEVYGKFPTSFQQVKIVVEHSAHSEKIESKRPKHSERRSTRREKLPQKGQHGALPSTKSSPSKTDRRSRERS